MKNKFLKLLTIILLVCATLFTLSACEEKHTHLFDKQVVTEDYFCSAAACEVKAKYYLSCTCGEKGSETFEYGNALEHSFTNYVFDNNASYEKDGTKTATCDNGCGTTDTINADGTKLDSKIAFKTLSVDGENASTILPNATEEFSFAEEIEIIGIVTFEVASDIYVEDTFLTKTVPLNEGDNTFYVFEMEDGKVTEVYTVNIRRRPNYTISFNSNGGPAVESQTVEEGLLATKPADIEKAGYTFDGWDFDFNTPVTQNETANAKWIANTNTPYKVEYYLQNIDDDNYILEDTENLTGTTDTIANAEIKTFPHFTAEQKSVSGRIYSDGSTVLKVYYTRNYYKVTVQKENDNGTVTGGGNYKYNKTISVKATVNIGYTFDGWYDGNDKVSDDLEYTFNPVNDITLTAKWVKNQGAYTIKLKLECTVRNKNVVSAFAIEEDILVLGFTKSNTEENVYFKSVDLGDELTLINTKPLDNEEYAFSAWKYVDGNKKVTVKAGTVINAENFPVLESSNELVLIAQCYALWTPFY